MSTTPAKLQALFRSAEYQAMLAKARENLARSDRETVQRVLGAHVRDVCRTLKPRDES